MRLSGLCSLAGGEEKSGLEHRTLWPAPSCLAREWAPGVWAGRAGAQTRVTFRALWSRGLEGWVLGGWKGGSKLRAKPQFRSWVGWSRGAHRCAGEGTTQSAWPVLAAQPGL